ncbi:copper chaperone PCu(A)C [Streptomyces sp. RY43-2]|uniref:Copper chaperone PCu(A)C n=1 Tax=Streptomyces macrolidinus TaxID=2952607 RepID=A0ABT0ZKE8_9ACTN|nr:copper chaperone PCu(A)C [Streptomyces macrolidinus]MCN9244028.1 copper chaperone PCu(A)C [Streptomyces macrolidinus]
MSSSLRRGALAAAAIAFSITALTACGAGNDAQTLGIKPDHAATAVGDIKIQNAIVITQPDQKSGGPAVVAATVFNDGRTPQTLDSIAVEGAGTADLTPVNGSKVTVPAGGSVVIGGKGNTSAVLSNPGEAVKSGSAHKVTFSFSKTGDVSLEAFAVPAESYFTKWGPTAIPSPAAPEAPSESATASPSEGAPSGSPSATAGH